MRVYNIAIATAVGAASTAIPMNANFNSMAYQCWQLLGFSIQVEYTATPTGTFKLQCSDDPVPQGPSSEPLTAVEPTNWSDVANSSIGISASGDYTWNVTDVFYNWVRLVYVDGSGGLSTATFHGRFNGKGY